MLKKSLNAILMKDITYPNLKNQEQFRLNKINEIKEYFTAEIKQRELMSKRLSKYIVSFDYFDKPLIFLSVSTGSLSIAAFATVIGALETIVSAILFLHFQFL